MPCEPILRRGPASRGKLAAVVLLLAFALVGVLPSSAFANVGSGWLGLELNVPSTTQQGGGAGDSGSSGTSGSPGWLGIELEVPDTADDKGEGAGGGSGTDGGSSNAPGWLGIELNVPSTTQQGDAGEGGAGSGGASGSPGWLGIELEVPDTTDAKGGGSGTGSTGGSSNSPGWLGIELNVPSTTQQGDAGEGSGGASGSPGWLGIELEVTNNLFVTFDANGGTNEPALAPCTIGQTIDEPATAPIWPGREFTGWYTVSDIEAQNDDTKWDFATDEVREDMSAGGMRLYAGWEWLETTGKVTLNLVDPQGDLANADECGITPPGYEPVEGAAEGDPRVYEGGYYLGGGHPELDSTLQLPEAAFDGDGDFAGWYKEYSYDEATGTAAYSDGPYTQIGRYDAGDADGGQAFYAKWEYVTMHTVSFDLNYETAPGTPAGTFDTQRVKHGSQASTPAPAPEREGYTFTGWYTNAGCTVPWSSSARVTADEVLYAGWSAKSFTVSFDTGENGSHVASQSVKWGEHAVRPADPTHVGYVFDGWFADKDCSVPFDFGATAITGDTTVYAKWKEEVGPDPAKKFTVTFDANGGAWENGPGADDDEAVRAVGGVADGATVDAPDPAPKRAGWQFAGWYLAAAGGEGGAPEGAGADGAVDGGEVGAADADGDVASAVPLGGKWDFGKDAVTVDTTLYAKWDLRLDVTVPVSVGFAVDAGSHAVTTPDAERYALKSRTVRPVTVDEVSVASEEAELGGFFDLADASAGWAPALRETELSLAPQGGSQRVALALAKTGAAPAEGGAWENARELTAEEKGAFTMEAFSYEESGEPFDEGWQGVDPSEVLSLKLGMTISDKLRVKTALDGPKPITHLKLTVSARA